MDPFTFILKITTWMTSIHPSIHEVGWMCTAPSCLRNQNSTCPSSLPFRFFIVQLAMLRVGLESSFSAPAFDRCHSIPPQRIGTLTIECTPIRFVFHALFNWKVRTYVSFLVCKLLSGPQVLRFCSEFHRRAIY